jgi:hypothetical protein
MAYLPESPVWEEGVYQYEITDKLQSGADGVDNIQGKQLANRTAYLKEQLQNETEAREEGDAALQQQVDTMKGRGGYLTAHDFGSAPTQEDLTAYALAQIGQADPEKIWNGTHVKNLNDSHVWVLTNTPDTELPIFEWTDDGFDSISQADNEGVQGVVTGGLGFDEVYVEPSTAKMKVPGLRLIIADQVEGISRNLFDVFGIKTGTVAEKIAAAMAEIRRRCNNNGEIDNSGIPDFTGIMVGDYIDGLDLSGIGAPTSGTAPQAWNDTYKNNRIIVSGFNTFKGVGDTEVTKNHILFTFRNVVARGRMNPTNDNTGGYPATEFRAWLEGASGDGSGPFAAGLKAALGGNNPLLTIRKLLSNKIDWAWVNCTVWPSTEDEVFGESSFGESTFGDGLKVHFPIYQKSSAYRVKRYNGSRDWWWEGSPYSASAACFCNVGHNGNANYANASSSGGAAPAFCVA